MKKKNYNQIRTSSGRDYKVVSRKKEKHKDVKDRNTQDKKLVGLGLRGSELRRRGASSALEQEQGCCWLVSSSSSCQRGVRGRQSQSLSLTKSLEPTPPVPKDMYLSVMQKKFPTLPKSEDNLGDS